MPTVEPLEVTLDREACAPARVQGFDIGPNGELPGAVVFLGDIDSGKAWPELADSDRIIDQQGCRYLPRFMAVPVGTVVQFRNSDPIPHNVRVESGFEIVLNVAQPHIGGLDSLVADKEGPLTVACDYHPWMFASIFVVPTPYYAVADSNGVFTITDIPPGTYNVLAWYPDPIARRLADDAGKLVRYAYGPPYTSSREVLVKSREETPAPIELTWRGTGGSRP